MSGTACKRTDGTLLNVGLTEISAPDGPPQIYFYTFDVKPDLSFVFSSEILGGSSGGPFSGQAAYCSGVTIP